MCEQLQTLAYGLGMRAKKEGIPCVPAQDEKLRAWCTKGKKTEVELPYYQSWIKGWYSQKRQQYIG